jgi:hypothetical protein
LVEFGGGLSGYRVRGVLPRGASEGSLALADGTVVPIGLSVDNGFAITPKAKPLALTFTGLDGREHKVELSGPQPPAPAAIRRRQV